MLAQLLIGFKIEIFFICARTLRLKSMGTSTAAQHKKQVFYDCHSGFKILYTPVNQFFITG